MAELSTQHTAADAVILRDPRTQALRARIAPYLALLSLQRAALDQCPSYVRVAVDTLLDSLARWERDERSVS